MKLETITDSIPRLFKLIIAVTILTLVILFAMRLAFWLIFHNPADPVPSNDLLYAFYLGTKFDLRLTLYVLLPLFLLGWIKWFSPFTNKYTHHFWLTYLVLAASGVLMIYLLDFGHYAYLNKRVDATVLRFLSNFSTSTQMVWQSYSVVPWTLAIIILIAIDAFVINYLIHYFSKQPAISIKKRHKLWIAPLSFFIFIFAIFGKFSYYPLRWSDAFFSPHAYASSVASNPVLYFFNTLKNKEIDYDIEKTQSYYPLISEYLGVKNPDKKNLNFTRHYPAQTTFENPPNIVMVFLESFSAYKTGAFGNKLNPTPYFDELEKNSISFRNFFTPHTGTARSVFAAVTGLPDIEVNKTSSRNPLVVDQKTIINSFKDHEKFYFIGGSANWGNVRGVLQHNIRNLNLYEEGSYTLPRMDVWGIDDASLFIESNWVLRKQTKPFFAIIQTSGNHRPYHIPEESYGFSRRQEDIKTLKKNGFISVDEFNAFRFLDHSVGHFIKEASKEAYFENTIFVFYGDHGIPGYPGEHSPHYMTHTGLTGLHTPLIFYAPKLLETSRIKKVASELDLLPTLAGLAGVPYTNTTLGRNLFDPEFDNHRYVFTIGHSNNSTLGLISNDFYFRIFEDGTNPILTDIHAIDSLKNVIDQHPAIADKMRDLTFGLFESTKYLLHHNKSEYESNSQLSNSSSGK